MYSFEEVVRLLDDPYPRMSFDHLEKWIRDVMKDEELAGEMHKVVVKDNSEYEKTLKVRDLMAERLSQCENIA